MKTITTILKPSSIEDIVEHDENGNIIHIRYVDGYEAWSTYDENSNLIYHRNTNGFEAWYNELGNIISNPNK